MEELLKNKVVRAKIDSLSAPVKKAFIESLVDLYVQEAEEMIDVIEESRMELREDFLSFTEGTDRLRAESRMLEQRRKDCEEKRVDEDLRMKGAASRNSRLSFVDEQKNQEYVHNHRKKRGKRHVDPGEKTRSSSAASVQDMSRSISVISTRSTRTLPTPSVSRTIEEETESVMKNLTTANIKMESERIRQTELLEQRRERRRLQKQSKEEQALELLEKALLVDRQLAEKKQQQEIKVKERLEEMKKKKQDGRETRAEVTTDTRF